MEKLLWERVITTPGSYTDRLKVFGGWLVRIIEHNGESSFTVAAVFVPDPNHEWKL